MHHPYTTPPFHQASRFTSAPRLYWKLKCALSWISCYFGILGNIAGRISQILCSSMNMVVSPLSLPVLTICKYFDGICQSPSLYFRTSPVCGGATIQNKSPGHLSGSVFKWGKKKGLCMHSHCTVYILCTPTLLHCDQIQKNWGTHIGHLQSLVFFCFIFWWISLNAAMFWFQNDFA